MLSDEYVAFLRAIFKWPADWTTRLVYADWLDEHAHPGGELLRLRHELAVPTLSKTARAKLTARERKVLKTCDREWIVQLERADWKLRYLDVRPADEDPARWARRRKYLWSIPGQRAMTLALADFEAEVGLPLPCSWKSFALACGGGELNSGCVSVGVPRKGDFADLQSVWSVWKELTEAQIDEHYYRLSPDVRPWIRRSVRFGTGQEGDFLIWNTSRVTDRVRSEYEIVLLNARYLDCMETFDSFQAMWDIQVERGKSSDAYAARPFSPK